jgi:D-3-phosphoglycerate dehydrogenase
MPYPPNKVNVLLVEGIHPVAAEMFRGEGFEVTSLAKSPAPSELKEMLRDTHVVGIRSKTELTAELLAAAPKLATVGCFCIGTNQVDTRFARRSGVPVFNSPFSNTRSVAELTIAEIICLERRLTDKNRQMHEGVWDKSAEGAHEVRGITLGIIGYGHIGSQVSVLAESLGMRVVYYDVLPKLAMGNARPLRTLNEVLEMSDVITLHVPATAQTEKLIGAPQIARMKKGAYVINNARGSVVDLEALAGAIRSGQLGGAALDVFPDEPAGKGETFSSAVQGLNNVILTPHVGGSTEEAQQTIAEDVCSKMIKFLRVGSTTGAVNVPEVELPDPPRIPSASPKVQPHRVLHFHDNVPGVLSKMHGAIAELGANISAEYLRTHEDLGYVVLDVDPTDGIGVLERLRTIPETIRVRMVW